MILPEIKYTIIVKETTPNVPEHVKVFYDSEDINRISAVRGFVRNFNKNLRVYSNSDLEEKAIKALEKQDYIRAVQYVHGLAQSNSHEDLFIFNTLGQFVSTGNPEETIPLLVSQQKGDWNGTQRSFECKVSKKKGENEKTA